MAQPIVEQISDNLKSTLEAVTVANGWNVDLTVERFNRKLGNNYRDNLVVIKQMSPSRDTENESQGQMWWLQPYDLDYFVIESEKSATPIDQRINVGRADIEKKLLDDFTRNGLAVDTRIDDPEVWDSQNGEVSGVTVRIVVQYRTDYEDPYSQ